MDFLSQFIIAPSGQHLKLLEFLAVLIYAIHLPYIAMVIGSTALAMWLTFSDHELPTPHFARLADDLLRTFLGNGLTMFVLGVLPLLALPFVYGQWFDEVLLAPLGYIVMPIPGIFLGLACLRMYRASYSGRKTAFNRHMGMGLLGLALLLGSYFVLISSVTRLQDPEKWYRLKNLVILLLNWNVIYKFLYFVHAAFAITGVGILFFMFRWSNRSTVDDPEYAAFVRKFGAGMALAFCFALPVFNLLYVFTSPDVVFDGTVYLLAVANVFLCMVIAYMMLATLRARHPRFLVSSFVLVLLVFITSSTFDVRAMANANREHAVLLETQAEKEKMEREANIEAAMAAASGANLGEETFNKVCMQCHRFNEKLVGPPLAQVLPNYTLETLKAFLANPNKSMAGYPPMPNPGLTQAQIAAVAEYELSHYKAASGGAAADTTQTQTEVTK
ncbi:MAG TPA: cytochrome c [Candidatus Krumholzibacteria bacterium]|nr:cytochrome c [Candidatus Krumholzibacteria bacterium]